MSFADPGSGRSISWYDTHPVTPTVTLAGTVKCGDLIGYSSGWKRADADTGPIKPWAIALADGISGQVIPVATRAVVSGFTGATDGGQVYPSGTAGSYSDSQVNSQPSIGVFISTTAALIAVSPGI